MSLRHKLVLVVVVLIAVIFGFLMGLFVKMEKSSVRDNGLLGEPLAAMFPKEELYTKMPSMLIEDYDRDRSEEREWMVLYSGLDLEPHTRCLNAKELKIALKRDFEIRSLLGLAMPEREGREQKEKGEMAESM